MENIKRLRTKVSKGLISIFINFPVSMSTDVKNLAQLSMVQ